MLIQFQIANGGDGFIIKTTCANCFQIHGVEIDLSEVPSTIRPAFVAKIRKLESMKVSGGFLCTKCNEILEEQGGLK